jgi:hypothetical protein
MIYFFNAQGTTVGVKSEPIYQGSVIPNGLVVVVPFASNIIPSVAFTLPNGLIITGGNMERVPNTEPIADGQGTLFNAWSYDLDLPITQYAGTVNVQFTFATGHGTPKSYMTQFIVQRGVPNNLPDVQVGDNLTEVITAINSYLASIGSNTQEALENSISYVRYIAPSEDLLNGKNSTCNLFVVNGTSIVPSTDASVPNITNGDFTVASMTEYLTENQIQNPNIDNSDPQTGTLANKDTNFFQYNTGSGTPSVPAGFIVELPQDSDVGILQLYMFAVQWDVTLNVSYKTEEDADYTTAETFVLKKMFYYDTTLLNEMQIIRVPINAKAKYIKVEQIAVQGQPVNGAYVCKGLEIFKQTISGYYRIVQVNHNYFDIDTFNAESLITTVETITEEAQGYSEQAKESEENAEKWAIGTSDSQDPQYNNSAKDWAESITRLAGQKGGYPILEEIGGSPKIPSVYINLATDTTYITIQSEEDLHTTENISKPTGTIARLVIDIDGENGNKVVTKSFVKLGDGDEWALWGASYADNASNALYSEESTNALNVNGVSIRKMTQAIYDLPTTSKDGIVFVTID